MFELKRIDQSSIVFATHSREVFVNELEIRWKTEKMITLHRFIPFPKEVGNIKLEGRGIIMLEPPTPFTNKFDYTHFCKYFYSSFSLHMFIFVSTLNYFEGERKLHLQDLHLSYQKTWFHNLLF